MDNPDSQSLADSDDRVRLSATQIERDPSSYVDPYGFVFHWEGRLFRYVHPAARSHIGCLFEDGSIRRLTDEFHLVRTWVANIELEGFDGGLVLEHEKLSPVTYCSEWCPSMLRSAAQLTLDLHEELIDRDMGLQDAYPWNIVFDGPLPRFVDLTSIAPGDPSSLWPAQEQFEAFFFRPLALSCEGKGAAVRALLLNNIEGINLPMFHRLVSAGYKLRHPGTGALLLIDGWLQGSAKGKSWAYQFAENAVRDVSKDTRKAFVRRLNHRIDGLTSGVVSDPWKSYYADLGSDIDPVVKLDAVSGILARLHPETVLDLGCNTGVFSLRAAEIGAKVVALDSSEACIEGVFRQAEHTNASVSPVISDVVCPAAGGGFLGIQYPNLWHRVRSDVVLCLGLMHHLHVNGRQSFDRIARLMDVTARKAVVFEYVAMDDANVPRITGRRPIDYSLETVEDALRVYFPRIDRLPSDRPTRSLLVCER